MLPNALVALFALVAAVDAANDRHVRLAKRQSASPSSPSSSSPSSSPSPSPSPSPSASFSFSFSNSSSLPNSTSFGSVSPVPTTPVGTTIPPLSQITSGMPTPSSLPVSTTYRAGATPPISGAPPLPTPFVFYANEWPKQDQVAPTNNSEVVGWMSELDGFTIPDIPPTTDGTCAGDPQAAADAASRGWWTCGGYTRPSDITNCNAHMNWGVSFDDGPSPYSQELLDYLSSVGIRSTFFAIGSRIVERSAVLVEEYMAGHEVSVHTWSHRPLTSLTTEQVVAELGYTRKIIKQVLGVTPTTMRPPYGDIDDRVRAICLAMGMTPIIWSRTESGATFDTNDWKVASGVVTGSQSFTTFETILKNATSLETGFIVLEHDLYPQTVDLAIGYTLPMAMNFTPAITFSSIGSCNGIPATNLYRETNQNQTFPYPNTTVGGNSSGTGGTGSSSGVSSAAALSAVIPLSSTIIPLLVLATWFSLL